MLVFKCFYKIILKNKFSIGLYIGIFMAMTIIFATMGSSSNVTQFSEMELRIGVVDQDGTKMSQALTNYLDMENELVDVPDDKEKLQDMIFYRDIEYVMYIPKGFQKDILANKTPELINSKVPNSYTGTFMDMKVNTYINTLSTYLKNNMNEKQAIEKTNNVIKSESKVVMKQESGGLGNTVSDYISYYRYFSYIIVIIVILGIGLILTQFNRVEIRRRINVSRLTQKRYNSEMGLACGTFAFSIWFFTNVVAVILYRNSDLFFEKLPWLVLNSFIMTIVSVALGYMCSFIVKTANGINGIGNTFSLAFAFLGGIFVPIEMMNKSILKISHFVPTYWYAKAIDIMKNTSVTQADDIKKCFENMGIQIVFAIAFFGIALIIKKMRRQQA